jgi:hypothetical protein
MLKTTFILFLLLFSYILPQEKSFEFFPGGLNFPSLKANNQEAKIGLFFYSKNNNMKIDIGNNIDVLGFRLSKNKKLTMGMEFMAYALSTSYSGKRLQINAIDGLFGGNLSYSVQGDSNMILMRLRIIHNSAHLVDGAWDESKGKWIDNYEPVPFAKDFVEYTFAYECNSDFFNLKSYAGLSYNFLIRPADIKRLNIHAGFELALTKLLGPLLGQDENVFLAHHFILGGTDKFGGNNNSMLGIKFGDWQGKGLLVYLSYYTGFDLFDVYYKRKVKRFGVGFSIDFL